MLKSIKRYFVYTLLKPDGQVFYVGKSMARKWRTNRLIEHIYEAKQGHICHKCNIIRKIWREGLDITAKIIFETDIEQEALNYEKLVIAQYERAQLANVTDGGEGMSGYTPTKETREKVSQSLKGKVFTPERRLKISLALTGIKRSPETIAKFIGNTNGRSPKGPRKEKTKPLSEAHKMAISLAAKGRIISPETRVKIGQANSKAQKGKPKSQACREAISLASKGKIISPETRQKISKTLMGRKLPEERRAKISLGLRNHHQSRQQNLPEQMTLGFS